MIGAVTRIAASTPNDAKFSALLELVRLAFPKATNFSLMLHEDLELIPRAAYPPGLPHVSFTLAMEAVKKRSALRWLRSQNQGTLASSLVDTTSAIYAPLIYHDSVIGVVHLDTTMHEYLTESDLSVLQELATSLSLSV